MNYPAPLQQSSMLNTPSGPPRKSNDIVLLSSYSEDNASSSKFAAIADTNQQRSVASNV